MKTEQPRVIGGSLRRRSTLGLLAALGAATASGALAQDAAPPAQVPVQPAPQAMQGAGPASVADLAEGLLDAVVNISTSQTVSQMNRTPMPNVPEGSPFEEFFDEFFGEEGEPGGPPGSRRVNSLGSGFVIDAEEGIIVTNNHVIEGADDIEVNFSDGSSLEAELIGTDPKTDLAVLKVTPPEEPLTEVPFGDSEQMRIGDWVMAIGNPFGLGGSVSVGIVSARGRDINAGPYDDFIQTDAAINRGNSGGPLFNMHGEVIGINTAIISPTGGSIGIGFSVPSELAINVIGQLREFGETRRGWLGVRIQPVTDEIAESLDMTRARGALVAGVINGGPVDDGTIQPGDVIIRFDDKDVVEMRDLPRIVAESPVGDEVDVVILRNGEEQTVQVTLGRLEDGEELAEAAQGETPDGEPEDADVSALGLTLGDLNDEARATFDIAPQVEGVVITEVDPASEAAEKQIQPGEVIVEIAQETVGTPDEVTERLDRLREDGRRNALLMIADATGELRFVTIRMD